MAEREYSKEEITATDNIKKFAIDKFMDINTKMAEMSNKDKAFFFICQAPLIQLERYKVQMGDLMVNTKEKFIKFCNYYLDMLDAIIDISDKTIEFFQNFKLII